MWAGAQTEMLMVSPAAEANTVQIPVVGRGSAPGQVKSCAMKGP